jgi:hypothetical protein
MTTTSSRKEIVLPGDVYDALRMHAGEHGGIGRSPQRISSVPLMNDNTPQQHYGVFTNEGRCLCVVTDYETARALAAHAAFDHPSGYGGEVAVVHETQNRGVFRRNDFSTHRQRVQYLYQVACAERRLKWEVSRELIKRTPLSQRRAS